MKPRIPKADDEIKLDKVKEEKKVEEKKVSKANKSLIDTLIQIEKPQENDILRSKKIIFKFIKHSGCSLIDVLYWIASNPI